MTVPRTDEEWQKIEDARDAYIAILEGIAESYDALAASATEKAALVRQMIEKPLTYVEID